MAIHLVDSGATISLEFTVDYNAGKGIISAGKTFINKDDFEVGYEDTFVVIRDKDSNDEWKIVYSDITTPSGASAAAVAALIEAFQDTIAGAGATAANQATQITAEQAIQASVQIIDDWDESDRAKVNPIVGQAGVAGGEGAQTVNTTRVILANTNQPTLGTSGTITIGSFTAGETHLGEVGGKTVIVNGSFTRPSDTTTYAANDVICNSTSAPVIITFSGCARVSLGSGEIQSCVLTDSGNETLKLEADLFIFDTTVTMDNDNAAFTPTDGEMATCLGVITFSASSPKSGTAGTGGNCQYPDSITKPIPFVCLTSTNLFGILVARNAYVPISAEVFTFRLGILQN